MSLARRPTRCGAGSRRRTTRSGRAAKRTSPPRRRRGTRTSRKEAALCEKAESLAESTNWIQTAEEIKRLQAEWKTIGPVSRGREKAIWERFRSACDRFFTRRHEDLAKRKTIWAENLAKKEALCEQAEALAQSTEWDQTAARDQAAAGGMENHRAGQEDAVGSDLAAVPRRLRCVLLRGTRTGTTSRARNGSRRAKRSAPSSKRWLPPPYA